MIYSQLQEREHELLEMKDDNLKLRKEYELRKDKFKE